MSKTHSEDRRTLLLEAARRSNLYLDRVNERPVAPSAEALARLPELGGPLPQESTSPAAVLAMLDEIGSPASVASAGGRYFGFVIGGALPATIAANWLATAWDQNAGLRATSPLCAAFEDVVLEWLAEIFDLPRGLGGAFVTGASMASLSALAAARHALLARAGWDVEAEGLFGAPPLSVIVSEEVHVTVLKALALLGLGRERVTRIKVDDQGRMRADALPRLDDRTIVCIQAGNVNTGSFDPAAEICRAAADAGAWVHVDGAFGMWAATSPSLSHLTAGMDRADSWATDAHKWLNTPYDCGIALVREPKHLRAAMTANAAYLTPSAGRDPNQFTPELSRRARAVEVWAALRSLGSHGVREIVERTCRHAKRFAEALDGAGLHILNEVVLNQVLVAAGTDEHTDRLVALVQEDGTCWCGGTLWQGRRAMRISVSSHATDDDDVERSIEAIVRLARSVSEPGNRQP